MPESGLSFPRSEPHLVSPGAAGVWGHLKVDRGLFPFLHHLGCLPCLEVALSVSWGLQGRELGRPGGRVSTGRGPSHKPRLATEDALPIPLIFSIKYLLVLFWFALLCICNGEPQGAESPSATSVFPIQFRWPRVGLRTLGGPWGLGSFHTCLAARASAGRRPRGRGCQAGPPPWLHLAGTECRSWPKTRPLPAPAHGARAPLPQARALGLLQGAGEQRGRKPGDAGVLITVQLY